MRCEGRVRHMVVLASNAAFSTARRAKSLFVAVSSDLVNCARPVAIGEIGPLQLHWSIAVA